MTIQLSTICFSGISGQAASDPQWEIAIPRGFTILGVSVCAQTFTGTPTNVNIDVIDDGTDVITNVAQATAGTPATWKSTALGGTNTPVIVDADSVLGVAVNFSGGTSPTATKLTIMLYGLWGAK